MKELYYINFSPSGSLYKKFNPRQTARVYSVEYGMYQVGGGYFVDQAAHVKFDR
ncbi:hypothetical protein ACEWK1_06855 [Metabacillus sp. YM-086]|uniref:hypothetical protein n=1 Tax=Metabacillus sp. YM-086 TaxID=3341729 RepID=UPI001BACA260